MVTTLEVTERVEEPTIVVSPPPEKLEGSVLVGESIVVGPLPGTPGAPASTGDKREFDGECAEGNHGATVSSVATEQQPGPEHGEAVAAAAQSNCGKDSSSKDADNPSTDNPSADNPSGDTSSSGAKTPAAPTTPADDKSKKKSDGDDD